MVTATGFAPVLLVPVGITAAPLLVKRNPPRRAVRMAAALLLLAWAIVSIASVGLLYLPIAVLSVVAASRRDPTSRVRTRP